MEVEGEDYQKDFPIQGEVNHQKFMPVSEFTPDYVKLLQAVQNRIENPQENDNLESIVKLVQKTECYALDSDCVKFDLCLLDKRTVIKITKELGISVKWEKSYQSQKEEKTRENDMRLLLQLTQYTPLLFFYDYKANEIFNQEMKIHTRIYPSCYHYKNQLFIVDLI